MQTLFLTPHAASVLFCSYKVFSLMFSETGMPQVSRCRGILAVASQIMQALLEDRVRDVFSIVSLNSPFCRAVPRGEFYREYANRTWMKIDEQMDEIETFLPTVWSGGRLFIYSLIRLMNDDHQLRRIF
jgi:hypothetical protein